MKYYVHFLTENPFTQEIETGLGSDAIYILDGRTRLDTMINDAYERQYKLRKVKPFFCGFRVYRGTRFDDNNTCLYEKITGSWEERKG